MKFPQLNVGLIWGGILAVAAALGLLANWSLDQYKDTQVIARSAGAQTQTMNAMASDISLLRKDVNKLIGKKRKAAVDTLAAIPAGEGFPGVVPFVLRLFLGNGKGGK